MSERTILICDDDQSRVNDWKDRLERLGIPFRLEGLAGQDLASAIEVLGERRETSRSPRKTATWKEHQFDKAAILIVDYDLLSVNPTLGVNGENVAYLARVYSHCGLIVGLNQHDRENFFDLSLKGHPESYADVNLSADQLHNAGLWRQPWTGFRPWYWPLLPAAHKALEARAKGLTHHLGDNILELLKFPAEAISAMPRSTIEYLGNEEAPEKITFRDFVRKSSMGLRGKDQLRTDTQIARVAAARVGKWLERIVLPGQDLLVDAPHLASRFPSLLRGDVSKLTTWNASTSMFPPASLWTEKGQLRQKISRHAFSGKGWLSRAAWFWGDVRKLEDIEEVRNPWSADRPDFVFCEDVSRFYPQREAREFVADLASSFVRRYVIDVDACSSSKLAEALREVSYRPKVRFSI